MKLLKLLVLGPIKLISMRLLVRAAIRVEFEMLLRIRASLPLTASDPDAIKRSKALRDQYGDRFAIVQTCFGDMESAVPQGARL